MRRTIPFAVILAGCSAAPIPAVAPVTQRAEGVVASLGYAQAIQVGNTIYVSGAVARGANMEEQVTGVYANLGRTLGRFGATLNDVVRETAYTTDIEALTAANARRKAAYGGHSPAATWVQITRLLMPSALIEVEVTAVIGSGVSRGAP